MTHLYFTAPRGAGYYRVALTLLSILFTSFLPAQECESLGTRYGQDLSTGEGLVVMEAEWPTGLRGSRRAGHGKDVVWTERTHAGASLGGFVTVATTNQNSFDEPDGSLLQYDIDFTETGTYYLYVRHASPTSIDNSIKVAVDGVLVQNTWHMSVPGRHNWLWERVPTAFQISTTGRHSVQIVHREDGTPLDKLVVSRNGARSLTGTGPTTTHTSTDRTVPVLSTLTTYTQDDRNLVVMEAERPTRSIRGQYPFTCQEWRGYSSNNSSNASYAMVPSAGVKSDSFNFRKAARLDYQIEFTRTGRYYVYLRHHGIASHRDAVWTDFDYEDEDDFQITSPSGNWRWETKGHSVSFEVKEVGTHIFSLRMREDGTPIDKIIISPNINSTVTGFGPATTEVREEIVYYQENGGDNLAQIVAEGPSSRTRGTGTYDGLDWRFVLDRTAFDDCYATVTDNGVNTGDNPDGPRLNYTVDFTTTGKHFIYIRHRARPNGNSIKVFFNGALQEGHAALPLSTNNEWVYTRLDRTIDVPSPGRHTLSIGMREDGFELDHIMLSTNGNLDAPTTEAASLPIELLSFSGRASGGVNRLRWVSIHEDNTETHLIERSASGRDNWVTIGTVTAAGFSQGELIYTYDDRDPLPAARYRIRTVDNDGSASISDAITIERERSTLPAPTVYPNPAVGSTTYRFDSPAAGKMNIHLYSLTGHQVLRRTLTVARGDNRIELGLADLPAGSYLLTAVLDGRDLDQQRLVVGR